MKSILVATDFSLAAQNAFRYAVQMARPYRSKVVALYVYEPPVAGSYLEYGLSASLLKKQEAAVREKFRMLESLMADELRLLSDVELRFEVGFAAEEILRVCEETQPDMLVMGADTGNVIARRIFGSTCNQVIQRVESPTLIVPEGAVYRGFSKIAYATDYEEDDIRVIDDVLYFAKKNHAKLACVHIRTQASVRDAYKQELLKRAYFYDLTHDHITFTTLTNADVIEGLQQYSAWQEMDLLVMLTHHRSRIGQLFHRSFSREMAIVTRIPLWVYPMKEPAQVQA
jgi:nucleotide-binding universal stress UspA family protein